MMLLSNLELYRLSQTITKDSSDEEVWREIFKISGKNVTLNAAGTWRWRIFAGELDERILSGEAEYKSMDVNNHL